MENVNNTERWRLVLGKNSDPENNVSLDEEETDIDNALDFLYGDQKPAMERKILITTWLKDLEKYFPPQVVVVLQKEAVEKLKLKDLLHSPELLASLQPDKNLIFNLIQARDLIPEETKGEVRRLVKKYIERVSEKYFLNLRERTRGAIRTGEKTYNPKPRDIDWKGTIKLNLKNYLPEYKTIIPSRLVGNNRNSQQPKHLFLLIDQSYSMADSAIYAGIASSILASLPLLKTRLIAFDTEIVELTEFLADPVDMLFGIQLGGGTFITPALEFVEKEIQFPQDSYVLLITDLYEGYSEEMMIESLQRLKNAGVNIAVLLSFAEKGLADYDKRMGKAIAQLDIPVIGCSTELFPDMIEAFFKNMDLRDWAVKNKAQKVN